MNYSFTDGSGNTYKLQNAMLIFSPMTAKMSSSGTYSGGKSYTIALEKRDLIKIIDVFERALWSEDDHADQRTMGSGTLFKKVGEESQRIYLSFRSDSLNEINNVLRDLKPNKE